MKHFYLMFMTVLLTAWQLTYAAETEPNNTPAQANTLTLNGSNSGKINPAGDVDWWKVSTNADGKLNITLSPLSGKSLWIYLYDTNGTTLLNSSSSSSTFVQNTDGLAAGTYYIKIAAVRATDTSGYTLSNTVTPASPPNDAEPNNSKTTAVTLTKNSTTTGHIGYYYNNKRDTSDWYKLTTTSDSKLRLKLTPANGQVVSMTLYAGNGVSIITSAYNSSPFSLTTDGLEADNYYVKINSKSSGGFTPYTLTDSVYAPQTDSLVLPLNYSIRDKLDVPGDADWWKVTTNADGKLSITLSPLSGRYVWVYLYDHDRTTLLNSSYSTSQFTQSTDGLAAGTYYVKVVPYYNTDTSSYVIADSLSVPAQANDAEPDNSRAQALTLTQNSSKTGHLGYLYNNKRDTADWYKLTTNADGLLTLNLTPANGSYTWIYLYDNDGTTLLNSAYSTAAFSLSTDGLAAGTYYVKVNCYYNYQFTPYTLSNSLTPPAQANDAEPNNSKAQALTLSQNSSATGHLGYLYNNHRDTADWYKVSTNADGLLKLSLTPANGSYTWIYLYDNDGTTLLNSAYSTAAFSLSTDGLAAGTYYVKVNCYYNNQFTPYTLSNSLTTYSYANDSEPNNQPYQAKSMTANNTVTGHVNFYYNTKRDALDWWKLNYTGSGNLQFTFNLATRKIDNGIPYVWFYVYKDTLAAPVYSNYFASASNVINLSSLAKANYYIKIIPYYPTDFDAYSISNSFAATASATMANALQSGTTETGVTSADVAVYPNPASSQLHISAISKNANIAALTLKDANGKTVWSELQAALSLKGSGVDVNVSRLPGGVYFLQVVDGNGKRSTKKVVISR